MMNSELEDPNNHVPAVTPDDDWGDIDPLLNSQLPPKRPDVMKSLKTEMVLAGYKSVDPDRPAESMAAMSFGQTSAPEMTAGAEDSPDVGFASVRRKRSKTVDNDNWGNRSKNISVRWMVYSAIGVIALISAGILSSRFLGSKDENPVKIPKVVKAEPAEADRTTGTNDDVLLRLNQQGETAKKIYARYATATRIEDFEESMYLRDRNLMGLNIAWKPLAAPAGWVPADKSPWTTHQNGNKPYGLLKGVNHDFSKFSAVFRFEAGELKLDWRATVGYGTANFADLKMGDGDASEIRGWISPSDFYTNTLPENRYHSFLVSSPDKTASIWVYTQIGSDLDRQILSMFSVSPITGEYQTEAMVTLSLNRGEQEILPRQWMVDKLLAMDWLDLHAP